MEVPQKDKKWEKMVFVELDEKGRMLLPKTVRRKAGTRQFEILFKDNDTFVLVPILPLKKLRGAFKTADTEIGDVHDIEKKHHA